MSVVVSPQDGVLLVRILDPRLDAQSGQLVRRRVHDLRSRIRHGVVIDMSQVEFIDSSGLTALLCILKFLETPYKLRLVGLRKGPQDILALTRLDRVLRLHVTVSDAVSSLSESPGEQRAS